MKLTRDRCLPNTSWFCFGLGHFQENCSQTSQSIEQVARNPRFRQPAQMSSKCSCEAIRLRTSKATTVALPLLPCVVALPAQETHHEKTCPQHPGPRTATNVRHPHPQRPPPRLECPAQSSVICMLPIQANLVADSQAGFDPTLSSLLRVGTLPMAIQLTR